MGKRKKKQQQKSKGCMHEYEIREVTDNDKWCKRRIPREGVPEIDAPFGYVITLPSCPSENTVLDNIKGYVIVRKKKRFGKVMLQVIKKEQAPQYGIKSGARQGPKKKLNRIINVKNLSKSGGD